MIDDKTIQAMADASVARYLADHEAAQRAAAPPTQTPEQHLAAAQFRMAITEQALLHGVHPTAVRLVLPEAEDVFELHSGAVVPRNGQTDPGDPLAPLTPERWLQGLATTDAYLFAEPGRSH